MGVESAADRAVFLADFGVEVSWVVGAVAFPVTAIFDHGSVRTDLDYPGGVLNRRGTLVLAENDLPVGAEKGDSVTVGGEALLVKSIEPDGQGMVVVRVGTAL